MHAATARDDQRVCRLLSGGQGLGEQAETCGALNLARGCSDNTRDVRCGGSACQREFVGRGEGLERAGDIEQLDVCKSEDVDTARSVAHGLKPGWRETRVD